MSGPLWPLEVHFCGKLNAGIPNGLRDRAELSLRHIRVWPGEVRRVGYVEGLDAKLQQWSLPFNSHLLVAAANRNA